MAASKRIHRRAECAACTAASAYQSPALRRQIPARLYLRGAVVGRAPTSPEIIAFIVEKLQAGMTPLDVAAATSSITPTGKPVSLPIVYREAAKLGLKLQRGGVRTNAGAPGVKRPGSKAGGARPGAGAKPGTGSGGARPGAGRPKGTGPGLGQGTQYSPNRQRALELREQGMTQAEIADVLKLTPQAVSRLLATARPVGE